VRTLILSDTFKDGNKLRQIRYMVSSSSPSITLPGFQVVTLQHACLPRLSQYGGALTGLTIHYVGVTEVRETRRRPNERRPIGGSP
jgi:hypothetical protein